MTVPSLLGRHSAATIFVEKRRLPQSTGRPWLRMSLPTDAPLPCGKSFAVCTVALKDLEPHVTVGAGVHISEDSCQVACTRALKTMEEVPCYDIHADTSPRLQRSTAQSRLLWRHMSLDSWPLDTSLIGTGCVASVSMWAITTASQAGSTAHATTSV